MPQLFPSVKRPQFATQTLVLHVQVPLHAPCVFVRVQSGRQLPELAVASVQIHRHEAPKQLLCVPKVLHKVRHLLLVESHEQRVASLLHDVAIVYSYSQRRRQKLVLVT